MFPLAPRSATKAGRAARPPIRFPLVRHLRGGTTRRQRRSSPYLTHTRDLSISPSQQHTALPISSSTFVLCSTSPLGVCAHDVLLRDGLLRTTGMNSPLPYYTATSVQALGVGRVFMMYSSVMDSSAGRVLFMLYSSVGRAFMMHSSVMYSSVLHVVLLSNSRVLQLPPYQSPLVQSTLLFTLVAELSAEHWC